MLKYGQIIYKVRDWKAGGYFSTSIVDHTIGKNVEQFDMYKDLITQYGSNIKRITKIAIQAPSGIRFSFGESQEIIIGNQRMFEIPYDDLNITSLKVIDDETVELYDIIIDFMYEEVSVNGN